MRLHSYIHLIFSSVLMLALFGCSEIRSTPSAKQHLASLKGADGLIYIDVVQPERIIQQVNRNDSGRSFIAFKIGFQFDRVFDNQKEQSWQTYFNYMMAKDWFLFINNDSLQPVFLQPLVKRDKQISEAILLFDLPERVVPEKLVFKNDFESPVEYAFMLYKKNAISYDAEK